MENFPYHESRVPEHLFRKWLAAHKDPPVGAYLGVVTYLEDTIDSRYRLVCLCKSDSARLLISRAHCISFTSFHFLRIRRFFSAGPFWLVLFD